MDRTNKNTNLNKVLLMFGVMWILAGIGFGLGFLIPPQFTLAISVVAVIVLLISAFVRLPRKVALFIVYTMPIIVGMGLNLSIAYYVKSIGIGLVSIVFFATVILFVVLALIGYFTKKDLSGMGTYLFVALIALIIISLLGLIIGFSSFLHFILAIVGFIIFSLYNVYDFNQIAQGHISDEDVPHMALSLFLNFVNMFLDLLRIVKFLTGEDD